MSGEKKKGNEMNKVATIFALAGCSAIASAQPATFLDLGEIGGEGTYNFSTEDSFFVTGEDIDTVLAIWDDTGVLLTQNDDGDNSVNYWSDFDVALTAGEYYLGISEYLSFFIDDFINIQAGQLFGAFDDGEGGTVVLNIDGVSAGSVADSDFSLFEQETVFFKVTVVPAPSALALLGLGGIVAGRRRR